MRFLILIALCLAVASATNTNRNRFNRLLRNLQRQQQQGQNGMYESQGLSYEQDNDQYDDQEDGEDDIYQQQQQCSRGIDMDDDDEESQCGQNQDSDEQDDDEQMCEPGQSQRQCRQQQQQQRRRQQQQQYGPQQNQQKRQQQQRHQCQPNHQLLQELEQPNCRLAAKLYKQAKQENDDKNTVVSPAAVQLALAAIQRGARGQTKRQLQRVLGAQLSQKQQQQACAALQQTLQGQQGQRQQNQRGQQQQAQVKTTTTIIINQKTRAQQKFIQAVKACQNAQVKQCNFQRQPQQCRQQINQYIAQKTNQKLQQVVPQQAITENTKMIVVSTAQLKARWGQQFRQQQQTKQGRFYPLGCQQPKQVQVLQSQGQFNYYEDEQLQIVGVPTQRQELTLYVIVPKDKDGLNEIEKQQIQNGQQLRQLLNQAEQQQEQIDLELPKFQIKHKIDAKQTLRQQGVQSPFDADEADLSGINGQHQGQQQQQRRRRQQQLSDDEDGQQNQYDDQDEQGQQQQGQQLHLNKLIHQATIKVDEQGISAARPGRQQQHHQYQQDQQDDQEDDENDDEDQQEQYEQQQFSRRQMHQEIFGGRRHRRNQQGGERKVKVNRAFAFAIKHNQSNQIVMVGRVVDATLKPKHQPQQGRQQQQSLYGVDQE